MSLPRFNFLSLSQEQLDRGAKVIEPPVKELNLSFLDCDTIGHARATAFAEMWEGGNGEGPNFFEEGEIWTEAYIEEMEDVEEVVKHMRVRH